jgi:hypothetical protein
MYLLQTIRLMSMAAVKGAPRNRQGLSECLGGGHGKAGATSEWPVAPNASRPVEKEKQARMPGEESEK